MNKIKELLKGVYASRTWIRVASTIALLTYPMGCIGFLLLPQHLDFVGGILIVVAILSFAFMLPSYIQRIALVPHALRFVDKDCRLDELELDLRRCAQAFAYKVFSILMLAAIMYMVIASDMANDATSGTLWMPTIDDHWLAILFGAFLYVLLLPLAYLAWTMPKPVIDDEPSQTRTDLNTTRMDMVIIASISTSLFMDLVLFDSAFPIVTIATLVGVTVDFCVRWPRKKDEN